MPDKKLPPNAIALVLHEANGRSTHVIVSKDGPNNRRIRRALAAVSRKR